MSKFRIESGDWIQLKQDAMMIREAVFIQEQQIAAEDEWDLDDAISLHFIVRDGVNAVATGRLLQNHSIGRIAVLQSYRGQGVGKLLMQAIIDKAQQQKRPVVHLSAQVHAIAFYESLSFKVEGEKYDECGIPHIHMRLVF